MEDQVMAWIESHQQLLNHPKTLDLMNFMGWDVDTTIGKLHRLWWWCLDYAPDGDLRKHNASRLAAALGLPPSQGEKLVSALVQTQWLDTFPNLRLHDWWDYIGPFLRVKYKRNPERWQRVRDLYAKQDSKNPDAQVYQYGTGTNVQDGGYSSGTNAEDGGYCTAQNSQIDRSCSVPPNQPNLPNQTRQNQQQQHPAENLRVVIGGVGVDFHYEHEGRDCTRETAPATTCSTAEIMEPEVCGIVRDSGTGGQGDGENRRRRDLETKGRGYTTFTPPVPATAAKELRQIIYDRIGWRARLSRLDMKKIIDLKSKHGERFYNACDFLHAGVTNPPAYLLAILEPEEKTARLVREVQELARLRGMKVRMSPEDKEIE